MKTVIRNRNVHSFKNFSTINKWYGLGSASIFLITSSHYHTTKKIYAEDKDNFNERYYRNMKQKEDEEKKKIEEAMLKKRVEQEALDAKRKEEQKIERERKRIYNQRLKVLKKDVDIWFDKLCEDIINSDKVLKEIEKSIDSLDDTDTFYPVTYYRQPINKYAFPAPENITNDELVDILYLGKYYKKIYKPGHKLHGCIIFAVNCDTDFFARFNPPHGMVIKLQLQKKSSECILF